MIEGARRAPEQHGGRDDEPGALGQQQVQDDAGAHEQTAVGAER